MKFIHSLLGNSFLMMVLFAMLFLPIGVMGLSSTQQSNEVLSQTSQRIETQQQQVDETTDSADLRQEVYNR